jgi:glutathione synthase/RimK-type ligase-like ATP-grasp enzyme
MRKIGIIYGMENTFPSALVDHINRKNIAEVQAEHIRIGAIKMAEPSGYRVIIDRISQDIDFYRTYLKNAYLNGTTVINNPFWASADDKFLTYSLACKLGVQVPNTVVLPHKEHPAGTTTQSMRNLQFPLDWDSVFDYVKFPAFLKPLYGGSWRHVQKVESPGEFFAAYDQSGANCMILQAAVDFQEYYRCYVVGQEQVRVMSYDPNRPLHLRYVRDGQSNSEHLHKRVAADCLKLTQILGSDFNTVEVAVCGGVPYVTDLLSPAPDTDVHSVGQANFDWVVENVAQLAIRKALSDEVPQQPYSWRRFLEKRQLSSQGAAAGETSR